VRAAHPIAEAAQHHHPTDPRRRGAEPGGPAETRTEKIGQKSNGEALEELGASLPAATLTIWVKRVSISVPA
jgi:hypothetical protein